MQLAIEKKNVSRYDLTKAIDLGRLGRPPTSRNVDTAIVAVPDPTPDPDQGPGQRILARVNRRVDILEWERSHGRITEDAYREGRILQWLFERAQSWGGSTWREGSRVDAEVAKEFAIRGRIRTAAAVVNYMRFMQMALGEIDAAIIRQVIGESRRYGDVVIPRRRWGAVRARHVPYVAERFRDALETLAIAAAQKRKARGE